MAAKASAISCCGDGQNLQDKTGKPCAECMSGIHVNDTVVALDRLLGVLQRWRCFGGDIAGAGVTDYSLASSAEVLQDVANSGCSCASCPAPRCPDSSWGIGWSALWVLGILSGACTSGCVYHRRAGVYHRRAGVGRAALLPRGEHHVNGLRSTGRG